MTSFHKMIATAVAGLPIGEWATLTMDGAERRIRVNRLRRQQIDESSGAAAISYVQTVSIPLSGLPRAPRTGDLLRVGERTWRIRQAQDLGGGAVECSLDDLV